MYSSFFYMCFLKNHSFVSPPSLPIFNFLCRSRSALSSFFDANCAMREWRKLISHTSPLSPLPYSQHLLQSLQYVMDISASRADENPNVWRQKHEGEIAEFEEILERDVVQMRAILKCRAIFFPQVCFFLPPKYAECSEYFFMIFF